MANDLAKLNRLRVNAGKTELKSWKASSSKLDEAIAALEKAGFKDVLPGANVDAQPIINDPKVAAARPPSLEDSALAKNIDNAKKPEPKVSSGKPHLARGLESDPYALQSRARVQDIRRKEQKDKKEAARISKADKKQIQDEAKDRKKGQVDPKKDPEKAKRQEKHIADKRAQREKAGTLKPAKDKNPNEITVADIARELDIDPKVARAKLRRHEEKISKLHTKGQDRWTFPKAAASDLKKILKGGK